MVVTEKLKHEMKKHRIRPYLLHKSRDSVLKLITYTLVLLCSFPIHLIGLLLNYLPYKIPVWFVNKNVKATNYQIDTYKKKIYVYGIALTSEEKDLVISEAKEIVDVEDVIASILLVEDLRIQRE